MNKIRIIAIIISVFLLVGATGCQTSGTKTSGTGVSYTGTEGLSLRFIDGMPPDNVWKDSEFEVGIDVQNKGLANVKEGYVCFGSFSEKVFKQPDKCDSLGELKGRLDFSEGEIKSYTWSGYELIESYKDDSNYPITAKVCYKGETRANPIVCVKSMSYETKSVCEGGEISIDGKSGQGAPVAVTSVYEDIIKKENGVDLRFTIKVSNVGSGEIFDVKQPIDTNCNIKRLSKNKVMIEAALTGYDKLKCGTNGEINFGVDGSEGSILCKTNAPIQIGEGESYPLPLNIKLNYGYSSSISSEFTIKKDVESEEEGYNVAEGDEFVLNR